MSHVGVTLAVTGLAAFLGNQSIRHRRREETYRALELELATLDPFLVTMEDEDRHRIKASLAPRYFVGIDPDSINYDAPQNRT